MTTRPARWRNAEMREKEEEVLGALGISREATFTQTEDLDS